MKLILGSSSPRRKEILTNNGYDFEVIIPTVEESADAKLGLEGLSSFNAVLKAEAAYVDYGSTDIAVIGSDTVVWLDNKPYGKPVDKKDAHRMLSELSGKTHQVCTAVCIKTQGDTETFCSIAQVTFKAYTTEEINAYINDIPVMDKAGSYAIQGDGGRIIEQFDGEFESIMGLPVEQLIHRLERIGVVKAGT